jgi:hypothetical protein
MLDMIQQSAISHDRYQVEIKLDYEMDKSEKTRYRISTFLFVPNSLGITEDSYPKNEFYRDIKNYIRIKTPELSLRDLIDNDNSPLKTVQSIIRHPSWYLVDDLNDQLVHALRLFGAMFKSSLRDHLSLIEKRFQPLMDNRQIPPAAVSLIEELIRQTERSSQIYRTLYSEFNLPCVKKNILQAYSLVDEYLSLLIEESVTELFRIIRQFQGESDTSQYCERLNEIVQKETAHRVLEGYGSLLKVDDPNETYAFRSSVIKKYVSGVLHLSIEAKREGRGIEQFLMALAAGISMVFATMVAFYFQSLYGSFTFPAFVALTVAYMFKDRIKEGGRALFAGKLRATLFDRRIKIRTLDGRYELATLREKITFMKENELPPDVRFARQKDPFADLDNDRQGETVICHTKDILLNSNRFSKAFAEFPKTSGLNDIIRYDIHPYLRKMADPVETRLLLDQGELKVVSSNKVYHLNIISQYSSINTPSEKLYKRMRVVLNRKGIVRIEYIEV